MKKLRQIVIRVCIGSFLLVSTVFAQDAAEDEAPRTGFFPVTMTAADLVGAEQADGFKEIIDPNEDITWQVYVPKNYSPGNPPGVLVYVSPSGYGGPPLDFNEVIEKRNLIWVGARDAGNNAIGSQRMLKAMLAVPMISPYSGPNVDRSRASTARMPTWVVVSVPARARRSSSGSTPTPSSSTVMFTSGPASSAMIHSDPRPPQR